MNLDERIDNHLSLALSGMTVDEGRESLKQLVRDVLEYVKPLACYECGEPTSFEAKQKELGL